MLVDRLAGSRNRARLSASAISESPGPSPPSPCPRWGEGTPDRLAPALRQPPCACGMFAPSLKLKFERLRFKRMSENVDYIVEKARTLTPGEKAELLDRLVELFGGGDLDPDWSAEIERRLDALDRGEMELAGIREVTYKRRS